MHAGYLPPAPGLAVPRRGMAAHPSLHAKRALRGCFLPLPADGCKEPGENAISILSTGTRTAGSKAGSSQGIWEREWARAGTVLGAGGPVGPPKLGIPRFRGEADSSRHPGDAETAKLMSQVSSQQHAVPAAASSSPCFLLQANARLKKPKKSTKTGAKGTAWPMPGLAGPTWEPGQDGAEPRAPVPHGTG